MLPVGPSPIADNFDRIPDDLLRIIFNSIQDIKCLTNCRLVSKRFNLIVSQTENILVSVDSVVSPEPGHDSWFLLNLIKSILQSLQNLVSREDKYDELAYPPDTPSEILRGFENIRTLEVELPRDLKLGKGTVIRWKAEFNKSLKSCVIFAVQKITTVDLNGSDRELDINGGNEVETDALKLRVVWTINALIAASARHYLLRDVIREHKELESLVLRDKDREGVLVMGGDDLNQFREASKDGDRECHGDDVQISKYGWKTRTTIPAVRMRMRHESKLNIGGGVQMKGATLVVIRPAEEMEICKSEVDEQKDDRQSIENAFEGIYEEAALTLVKKPSYLLEMNSF